MMSLYHLTQLHDRSGRSVSRCERSPAIMPPWVVGPWMALVLLVCTGAEPIPRITFQRGDPTRSVNVFHRSDIQHYDRLLLSEDKGTLYVGARDHILAFSTRDPTNIQLTGEISWASKPDQIENCKSKARKQAECLNFIRVLLQINSSHLYVCGTNAFSPNCTYVDLKTFSLLLNHKNETVTVDGKGQSPFDPQHTHTGVMVDGELYTGTMNNFMGSEPIILRSLGVRPSLKTDASLGWLHSDASFAGSFYMQPPDSAGRVYIFFEETGKEFDFFDKVTVSRVARVCKDDVGGDKVLQKKWTTFLKSQLVCQHQDNFPFNVIRHVALLNPDHPKEAVFYGVFSSQWQVGGSSSSAVCSFRLSDIEAAFNGHYKEQNKESSKWTRYTGPVSSPRPGSCSSGKFSDTDLNFMKDHFLMDEKVHPADKRPLLIQQSVSYTRIAIDSVRALSGELYTVLYLGTDRGSVQKAVLVEGGNKSHIIEELKLLPVSEPLETLLLDGTKRMLYVGSRDGLLQVPLANCSVYRTCYECVLARDPYCAWSIPTQDCQPLPAPQEDRDLWLQDIEKGNPNTTCLSPTARGRAHRPGQEADNPPTRAYNYTARYNSIVELPCPSLSSLASYSWKHLGQSLDNAVVTPAGSLVVIVKSETLGLYECWANENGFRYRAAQYWIRDPSGVGISHRGAFNGDSNMAFENGASFNSDEHNYYKPFVAVTVLLTLTLFAAMCLALYTWRDQIRAKSKIQGCSTPESEKLSGAKQPEKTPLNGFCQYGRNITKPCCVPCRAGGKMDVDNNSVNLTPNGGPADPASDV
ncbi:semaphorin-4A isoform X2 [Engystomops pustulosus]|uniref:semaphorin-4A isoform X2 n=1 Tax=Engystomops pustulosus TaxID=76066 RepID=UPI003AFA3132